MVKNRNAMIETLKVGSSDFIKLCDMHFNFETTSIQDYEDLLSKHVSKELDEFAIINIINCLTYKLLDRQLRLNKLRELNYPLIANAEDLVMESVDELRVALGLCKKVDR